MSAIESFITNTGFPVFIAMYLLIRFDHKIDKLVVAFVDLTEAINGMLKVVAKQNHVEVPMFESKKFDE